MEKVRYQDVEMQAAATELPTVHATVVPPSQPIVVAAQPVPEDFSARFSASHRTYRYFFVRGELELAPMREAAARLQGEFDFRNFCKIDPAVSNFRRTVLSATIQPAAGGPSVPEGSESPLDVFEFEHDAVVQRVTASSRACRRTPP